MQHEITILVAQNCIAFGVVKHQFTHRWESSVLAALSLRQAETQATAVTNGTLTKLLSDLGQSVPLNRKQLSRLFHSITAGLLAVGVDPSTRGIQSLPRKRTVGSWWWNATNSGGVGHDVVVRIADLERLKSALRARFRSRQNCWLRAREVVARCTRLQRLRTHLQIRVESISLMVILGQEMVRRYLALAEVCSPLLAIRKTGRRCIVSLGMARGVRFFSGKKVLHVLA